MNQKKNDKEGKFAGGGPLLPGDVKIS